MKLIKTIRNLVFDFLIGKKILGGTIKTRLAEYGAYNIANSDYDYLYYIFNKLCTITLTDVLVDVGCGKGRVINFWLLSNLKNQIYGIEIDGDISKWTARRLRKYRNVKIISGDINDNIPKDATIFYLFNPFTKEIMVKFKLNLERIFYNKNIKLIYYNSQHLSVFKNSNFWKIKKFKLPFLYSHQCAIITNC